MYQTGYVCSPSPLHNYVRETYYIVCQIDHINEYQYTLGFLFKSLCKQRLLVLHKILKKYYYLFSRQNLV